MTDQQPEQIYICPTCGANQSAPGRSKAPVYCDECGADWDDVPNAQPKRRAVWNGSGWDYEPINQQPDHIIPMEKITGETYPGRGDHRLKCDHCQRDYDLHNCAVCGGVTCGNCAATHHTHNEPTTTARCVVCGKPAIVDGIHCDNCFIKAHSGPTANATSAGE